MKTGRYASLPEAQRKELAEAIQTAVSHFEWIRRRMEECRPPDVLDALVERLWIAFVATALASVLFGVCVLQVSALPLLVAVGIVAAVACAFAGLYLVSGRSILRPRWAVKSVPFDGRVARDAEFYLLIALKQVRRTLPFEAKINFKDFWVCEPTALGFWRMRRWFYAVLAEHEIFVGHK
jgi:hypothetical protein